MSSLGLLLFLFAFAQPSLAANSICQATAKRIASFKPPFNPENFKQRCYELAARDPDGNLMATYIEEQTHKIFSDISALSQEELARKMQLSIDSHIKKIGYLPGLSPEFNYVNTLDKILWEFSRKKGDEYSNIWGNILGPAQTSYEILIEMKMFDKHFLDTFAERIEDVALWERVRREIAAGRWHIFKDPEVQTAYEKRKKAEDFSTNSMAIRGRDQIIFPNDP